MKTCPICGTQNEDSFSTCTICGAALPQVSPDEEKTTLLEPADAAAMSGLSLKKDENSYGQQPGSYGQQPAPGMNAGMPQQGMPGMNAGMSQQGMPGMNMGMPQQNMPGMNMGMPQQGMPGMNVGVPQAPVKANKGKIFAILGALTVVLVIAFILIFKGGKVSGGVKSSEDVARVFVEAMDERDVDKMVTLCPPFLEPGRDDIQDSFDELGEYDINFEYIGVSYSYDYSDEELKDLQKRIKDNDGANVKLQAACDIDFDYKMVAEVMGETYDEEDSDSLLAIKYKGKWFLYE